METLSPKDRLSRVLRRASVDRPPVACVGGMMNAAIVEVMERTGNRLPEAYDDPVAIAKLAEGVADLTGFENLALPFCMTLEAELLGSSIDRGTLSCEAKVTKEAFASVKEVTLPRLERIPEDSRAARVLEAVERVSSRQADTPVVGSLTGPLSTAGSVVSPMTFLKELRTQREASHRVLDGVISTLFTFAEALVEAGADIVAISDPTATGEILGPRAFEEYALRHLNELIDRIAALGVPVIVHICGDIGPVAHLVAQLHSQALSTDSVVNLAHLKREYPHLVTMGNVSTQTLQNGRPERIAERVHHLIQDGVDIIAPACGLSTSTPLANIRALTDAAREKS